MRCRVALVPVSGVGVLPYSFGMGVLTPAGGFLSVRFAGVVWPLGHAPAASARVRLCVCRLLLAAALLMFPPWRTLSCALTLFWGFAFQWHCDLLISAFWQDGLSLTTLVVLLRRLRPRCHGVVVLHLLSNAWHGASLREDERETCSR